MNTSIFSWLVLSISTISIFSDVATASASARCPGIDQRSLLLELRDSLVFNASQSSKLVWWNRSADSWSGVTCKDGLVVGLDLSSESISGGINSSSSLFRLEFLQSLNLAFNDFDYSAIPSGLANLSRLVHLNLSNARFDWQISAELSRLTKLRTLDLTSLYYYGSALLVLEKPPLRSLIGDMGELRELYLDGVDVSVEGSEWCDALSSSVPKLEVLSMSSCSLYGPIGASLMSLANLSVIRLDDNNLSTTDPSILAKFSSLKTLSLSDCGLQGEFRQKIFRVQTLQTLDLSFNELLQGSLPIFPENSSFQTLDLSFTNFSGRLPDSIDLETPLGNLTMSMLFVDLHSNKLRGNMPPLPAYAYYLDFSSNSINSVIPDDIGNNLPYMMFFSLSKNNIHGSIPQSICAAGYFNNLEVLDLSHNHLNGTIPDCLMIESLKVLNLRDNQLNGNIPQNILRTCNLKTLDISENLLQGHIPLSLAKCTMLEIVNIGNNQIDGTFPCYFKAISSLRILVLRSNKLHGEIRCPHSPSTWQMLQIIDLSSNDFRGTLPTSLLTSWAAMKANVDFNRLQYQFSQLSGVYYQDTIRVTSKGFQLELVKIMTVFTSIDFSCNKLEGAIPDTLGDLKALHVLNLSHNAISGTIPPVLGNLGQLESLDLSGNYLNGTIPAQLANLNFLSSLNLSNNQLVGSIPTSGQFLTFSRSSLEGNLGLCGLLLNRNCSITTTWTKDAGDDGDNDDSEKKWFYMGIPLGFVVGFWELHAMAELDLPDLGFELGAAMELELSRSGGSSSSPWRSSRLSRSTANKASEQSLTMLTSDLALNTFLVWVMNNVPVSKNNVPVSNNNIMFAIYERG
ncbi:receptor-like protein 19 [Syzygium oleosum]|uniref:receptor-like protein 19 n=1 Tax=Syzygium oleosum TaxID=219896 RepID=UPI0024B9B280|nr:receptor-like protein 19 [Syzygium oleosum]